MGRVATPQAETGGEVAFKRGFSAPARTSPPDLGFASATLPMKGRESNHDATSEEGRRQKIV